jgi:hypothetical protein
MTSQPKELHMIWSRGIRQFHRWTSIVFTLTVIANFVFMAMAPGQPVGWVTYSPLLPLALLMFTGLYLFAQPYITQWRAARRTVEAKSP